MAVGVSADEDLQFCQKLWGMTPLLWARASIRKDCGGEKVLLCVHAVTVLRL